MRRHTLSSDELGQSFEYTFDITDIESEHIYPTSMTLRIISEP